jgi:hypothetical protein
MIYQATWRGGPYRSVWTGTVKAETAAEAEAIIRQEHGAVGKVVIKPKKKAKTKQNKRNTISCCSDSMDVTTAEAAYIAGVSTATIRRHICLYNLDARKLRNGRYVIDPDELGSWMNWAWQSGSCYMWPPQVWPGLADRVYSMRTSSSIKKSAKRRTGTAKSKVLKNESKYKPGYTG